MENNTTEVLFIDAKVKWLTFFLKFLENFKFRALAFQEEK